MIPTRLINGGVFGQMLKEYGAAAYGLLLLVFDYSLMREDMCLASLERLSSDLRLDRKTIRRARESLLESGLLAEVQDEQGRKGIRPTPVGIARLALEIQRNIQNAEARREEIRKARSQRGRENVKLRGK